MGSNKEPVTSEIVGETVHYRLKDICEVCGVSADYIVEMVEAGILTAEGNTPTSWRFSAVSVMRSRKALRLQRDLELNTPGVALALDLLDEVETLRSQVKALKQQLANLQR